MIETIFCTVYFSLAIIMIFLICSVSSRQYDQVYKHLLCRIIFNLVVILRSSLSKKNPKKKCNCHNSVICYLVIILFLLFFFIWNLEILYLIYILHFTFRCICNALFNCFKIYSKNINKYHQILLW